MAERRKLPIENVHLSFDFVARSGYTPKEASFFLAVASGILEGLCRLKETSFDSSAIWTRLEQATTNSAHIAAQYDLTEYITSFKNILQAIKTANKQDASYWLTCFLEQNDQNGAYILEIGFRCVLSSLIADKEWTTRDIMSFKHVSSSSFQLLVSRIEYYFPITFLCFMPDGSLKYDDNARTDLLVCIQTDTSDNFFTLYHQHHLLCDTLNQQHLLYFPFLSKNYYTDDKDKLTS